jgi:hypothetical protein
VDAIKVGKSEGERLMEIRKQGDLLADRIIPFYYENCGFIEWYIENKQQNHPEP